MKFPHRDPIEEQLKQLKQAVDETVFMDWHVTETMKISLMDRIHHEQHSQSVYQKRWVPRVTAGSMIVCSVLAYLLINPVSISNTDQSNSLSGVHGKTSSSYLNNETAFNTKLEQSSSTQDESEPEGFIFTIGHVRRDSIESDGQSNTATIYTITSRHEEKPSMKVLAYTPDSATQFIGKQQLTDQDQAPITTNVVNDASNDQVVAIGLSSPKNPQGVAGNQAMDVTANGVITAPNALVGVQSISDQLNIQQLIQLSDGDSLILGQEQNGLINVYKLPSQVYYYGWTYDRSIGVYVLPSWKLPVTVTQQTVDSIQQSDGLHIIKNYKAIVTTTIPAHAPFLNIADPMRSTLLQLAGDHQLYAIQLFDGSVDFFSPKQKGVQLSTSIDSFPNSSFTFVAHIPDPLLYFYTGISSTTWVDLRNQIQWVTCSTATKLDASNEWLNQYPLYP